MAKNRRKAIQIRVTQEEYDDINEKANSLGLSVSSYVRLCATKTQISLSINSNNVNVEDYKED